MFTVKEVSNRLNISEGAIYKAIRSGVLEHHRFGSSIRITEVQLRAFLDGTRVESEPDHILPKRQFKHL
jgi:excisionase family DNA binding protein